MDRPQKPVASLLTHHHGQAVVFKKRVAVFPGHPGYRVLLKHLSSPEMILSWAHHLAGKTWATPQLLAEFIEGATARHNIRIFN